MELALLDEQKQFTERVQNHIKKHDDLPNIGYTLRLYCWMKYTSLIKIPPPKFIF